MNKNKILKIVAGSLAGVALGGALIYYNFVDKDLAPSLYVGDAAPDFVVDTYKVVDGEFQTGGDKFQLSKREKLTVINFWATWCGPCKAELPHFDAIQKKYAEYVDIIALTYSDAGGEKGYVGIGNWLSSNSEAAGWEDFSLTFGYYDGKTNDLYYNYGFAVRSSWPSTAIVDEDGVVVYTREGSLTYEELETEIQKFLPDVEDVPSMPEETPVKEQKNWWKENALGVTFLAVSAAVLGGAITVSVVDSFKNKKKKTK